VFPLLLVLALSQAAVPPAAGQSARIQQLEKMLLAPCCYTENVARHRSEVAVQMQKEIAAWVMAGKSDREILDTYKARYGARVLAEPEGAGRIWLHTIPVAVLLLGLLLVIRVLRRWRAPTPA